MLTRTSIQMGCALEISGKVTSNVARSPITNAKVQLMVPNMGFSKNVQTDAWGRFTFNNFDAPDSTVYWVKALSEEGKDKVTLQVDTVVHPVLKTPLLPYRDRAGSGIIKTSYEYLEKANKDHPFRDKANELLIIIDEKLSEEENELKTELSEPQKSTLEIINDGVNSWNQGFEVGQNIGNSIGKLIKAWKGK